jgi:hypothetical protein
MPSQEPFQAKPSHAQIYTGKVIVEIRSHPFSVKVGSPEITAEGKPVHKSVVPRVLDSLSYWQSN